MKLNKDFIEFISALKKQKVKFVVIGAYALGFLGHPRATGDLDIWINPTKKNAKLLIKALKDFGFESLKISINDILSGNVIQLGFPPVRIDLLIKLDGLSNDEIWDGKARGPFGEFVIHYIGKKEFIKNKKTLMRHKDLADVELLE